MARYRKKPVEIEARRVPDETLADTDITKYLNESIALAEWCGGSSHMMTEQGEFAFDGALVIGPYIAIKTMEGTMAARPGAFIIEGVQGEFYPCDEEIFHKTYDKIES